MMGDCEFPFAKVIDLTKHGYWLPPPRVWVGYATKHIFFYVQSRN